MIKCVCFDLGGVLVRIRPTWHQAIAACGIEPDGEMNELDSRPEFREYQLGLIGEIPYLEALSKALGSDGVGIDVAKSIHEAILVEPYSETFELVTELQQNEVATGCLSNTNELHWKRLIDPAFTPAIAMIQHKLASHIEHLAKPSREIYQRFEEMSGFQPEEIVYFDDSETYVEAAKSYGWKGFHIDPSGSTSDQMRKTLKTLDLL